MVFQDIAYGCGVGVLAPEQELITEEILPFIPEERMDDVVYVNPADLEYPIPLNPLHLGKWEDIDRTVDDLITVFGRLTNDLTPRMREILYHTFYALVEREGSTLLDVEILLDRNDPSIRNEIIYTTKNPRTARFFQSVFQRSPATPVSPSIPVSVKLSARNGCARFCVSPGARLIFGKRWMMEKSFCLIYQMESLANKPARC